MSVLIVSLAMFAMSGVCVSVRILSVNRREVSCGVSAIPTGTRGAPGRTFGPFAIVEAALKGLIVVRSVVRIWDEPVRRDAQRKSSVFVRVPRAAILMSAVRSIAGIVTGVLRTGEIDLAVMIVRPVVRIGLAGMTVRHAGTIGLAGMTVRRVGKSGLAGMTVRRVVRIGLRGTTVPRVVMPATPEMTVPLVVMRATP